MSLNKNQMIIFEQLLDNLDELQLEYLKNKVNNRIIESKNTIVNNNCNLIPNIVVEECPHCHSKHIVKYGKYKNVQKYRCNDCNKYFRENDNTILYKTKKNVSVWANYLQCMLDKKSLRNISKICNISLPTSFNWRHKILDIFGKETNKLKIDGIIESDETFTNLSFKGNHSKSKTFTMPRKAHKRGNQIKSKGLSKEKVCVVCALNLNNKCIGKVSNLGKPTWKSINKVIGNHIERGSVLVTDSFSGYDRIAEYYNLNHIKIKSGFHTNDSFNIQKINNYHSQLKALINYTFKGVSTKYLNNYVLYQNLISNYNNSNKTINLHNNIFNIKCNNLIRGSNRPSIPA